MFARRWAGRRVAMMVGVGLYALVLVASPLLHHDLDCHLKSPSHCGACTANPLAPGIESGVCRDTLRLPGAGRVENRPPPAPSTASPLRLPGRSPPA